MTRPADNPEPIEARHEAFARALVDLARAHGIYSLNARFHGGRDGQPWTRIDADWRRGRDGEPGEITLRAEAVKTITEKGKV